MTHFARLVWLDEADAQNPALVGAKASRLAEARSRGLPVLNGFAVPVDVSLPAIAEGEATLGSRNSGAARTSVYNHEAPPLFSELAGAAQKLGDSLVVRSSSRAESEGIWGRGVCLLCEPASRRSGSRGGRLLGFCLQPGCVEEGLCHWNATRRDRDGRADPARVAGGLWWGGHPR